MNFSGNLTRFFDRFLIYEFLFQAECYHYLFDAAIKLHQLGLDWSTPTHGPIRSINGIWGCNGTMSRGLKVGGLSLDDMIEPSQVSSWYYFPSDKK